MTYNANMYTPSIRSELHKQKLKSQNKDTIYIHQLATVESQDAKMAVTKELAGCITVAVPHIERNNMQLPELQQPPQT